MERILVIKHGALGDIVLATGPFQAIRNYHKDCKITLLTTKAYADILAKSSYFDEIWIDSRPKLYKLPAFLKMIGKIRGGHFDRVYDLQTSERTSWYFRLMAKPRPEWVGIAKGASHCHNTPERTKLHTIERQKQQLALAEITNVPHPDLSWLRADIRKYKLPERYAIIVAGGAEHRQGKRWAASNYAAVANYLVSKDIIPVLIGTRAEASAVSTIEAICPEAINLLAKTDFSEIAELARGAICAIGNDTGPMHIIATTRCPSLVLFSKCSDPAICAPRGHNVTILQEENLANLAVDKVIDWAGKF